jgi:hypothetical protein
MNETLGKLPQLRFFLAVLALYTNLNTASAFKDTAKADMADAFSADQPGQVADNYQMTPGETGTPPPPEAKNALGGDPTTDALVKKICPEVNKLGDIDGSRVTDVQKLYNNAIVAIAYDIYPQEFQKIKDACMTAKCHGGDIDTTTKLTPADEQKILVKICLVKADDFINSLLANAGIMARNGDGSSLGQLTSALKAIETAMVGAESDKKNNTGNAILQYSILTSKLKSLKNQLELEKKLQEVLAENKDQKGKIESKEGNIAKTDTEIEALNRDGNAKTAEKEALNRDGNAKTAEKEAKKTENAKTDTEIEAIRAGTKEIIKKREIIEGLTNQTP